MSIIDHMTTQEKIRRLQYIVKDVHEVSTMERASFGNLWSQSEDPLPTSEKEVTDFIRRRTDLWRKTWMTSPLEEALEILVSMK